MGMNVQRAETHSAQDSAYHSSVFHLLNYLVSSASPSRDQAAQMSQIAQATVLLFPVPIYKCLLQAAPTSIILKALVLP
jgi:hypothetical protein